MRRIMRREFGFRCPVRFFDHHLCHAMSAYYSSGFSEATVISMDGGGDGVSAKIYDVKGGDFREVSRVSSFDSLGNYYAYVTQICGFKAGRHEGKVTGLAAHGEPKYLNLLREMIDFEEGGFKNKANVFFNSALKTIRNRLPKEFLRENLAASIQLHAEDLAVAYTSYWLQHTKKPHVALVGGLCANVRINQRIHEIPGVQSVFVHPGMGDEGMGVGASLAAYYAAQFRSERSYKRCMDHVYLGPEYSDDEILAEISKRHLAYEKPTDMEAEVARLLADGFVVARFAGRMEYGPRALGNRSILYAPNDPEVNDWLNEALRRTEFMPFAPAVLAEDADQCFIGLDGARDTARFMTITFDCTPWMLKNCPGVVHIDGTARPQLVVKEDNPSYYRIISEYKKLTGLPCVVNTSLNSH
jgi:carbamoyltransferase